jgi:DNA-binding NtrC family response regulator
MLPATGQSTPTLLGDSAALAAVREQIVTASRVESKVLITGETGVGKEVVARLIHARSSRAARGFVAVNCSGIPETLLESELFGHVRGSFTGAFRDKPGLVRLAHGGILFLDELGEMSLRMQSVLLRFVETGELQRVGADAPEARTDVRLITATNRDLRARIAIGAFREDLYYRLNVIPIAIPPLRERTEDILPLFLYYLRLSSEGHGQRPPDLHPAACRALTAYPWPGNVRELKNAAERLVLRAIVGPIEVNDLPAEVSGLGRTNLGQCSNAAVPRADEKARPAPAAALTEAAERVWERLLAGDSFWKAVHEPFKRRELTRKDLASLIDLGLRRTRGNYRALLKVVNLPASDYKRFHAFLYQQKCNLPVRTYRLCGRTTGSDDAVA